MIYKPKHFNIKELVPPEYHKEFSDYALWGMFDDRILKAADMLREQFGKCVINDWAWGGKYCYSGLRPESWYKKRSASQHIFGRALDLKLEDAAPMNVRKHILDHPEIYAKYIHRVEEDTPTWVHIDCRGEGGGITTFKP